MDAGKSSSNPGSTGRGKSLDARASRSGKSLAPSPSASASGSATSVKKKKKPTSSSSKSDHYTNYIFKLLRQVKPGIRITRRAMSIMNSFVLDAFERIAGEAGALCTRSKKDTLTCNEVRTAVRLVLPGDLAKHAIMEGLQAVQTFEARKQPSSTRSTASTASVSGSASATS